MHMFKNDYSEGAHPHILEALVRTNDEQTEGYTTDEHCAHSAAMILDLCGLTADEADVYFVVGGTAANVICLNGLFCRPYDAVICTPNGHINTHETGALEATGHKILATGDTDGFVSVAEADAIVRGNAAFGEHMTRPQVIYVSDATELGGIYQGGRLEELAGYAHSQDMKLYLDGARLGCALTSAANDLTLPEIARLCDAFYIGGTKCGLLFGEAIVVRDPQARHDLPWLMKRHANLLAKGRLLGVQFEAAFEDGLWFECAANANARASEVRAGLLADGWNEWIPSASNQLFFEMPTAAALRFADACGCEVFYDFGSTQVVRFVTSWATTVADVAELLALSHEIAQDSAFLSL